MSDRRRYSRRRLLSTVGVGTLGALAGCSGGDESPATTGPEESPQSTTEAPATARTTATSGSGGASGSGGSASVSTGTLPSGSIPPYASLFPSSGEPLLFTAHDPNQDSKFKLGGTPEDPTDPLRFDAVAGVVGARVAGAFLLSLQLDFSVDRLEIGETTRVLTLGGVAAQVMPVDRQGVLSDVEGTETSIERRDGDSAVLVGPEDIVFGVTDDVFVFAPTPASDTASLVERIGSMLDARTGATTPRHESDPRFRSLLERGDTGGSVGCVYAPGRNAAAAVDAAATDRSVSAPALLTEGFASATGGLFHIDLDGETPRPASGTLLYPDAGAIDENALTGTVGAAATDRSYVRDGTAVRVEGTYPWESLRGFESDLGGVG